MVLSASVATGALPATGAEAVASDYRSHRFDALGTTCHLLFAAGSRSRADAFVQAVVGWVSAFEARYSRFRADSLVSEINRQAGKAWVETDEELRSLLALCDWFHWQTSGVFDPTSLPLTKVWDFRVEHAALPSEGVVREALALVGWKRVQRDVTRIFLPCEGMAIDLGGIGKEYAVDRVIEMAAAAGIRDILVDFGHDLRVSGAPPEGGAWRIGLEDPTDAGKCWAGMAVTDRAVATSGDYLRGFEMAGKRYGHVIDPRTGYPSANGCKAVSVVAPTCTQAGILSKAALILGPEEGVRLLDGCYQAEGCIWSERGPFQSLGLARYLIE